MSTCTLFRFGKFLPGKEIRLTEIYDHPCKLLILWADRKETFIIEKAGLQNNSAYSGFSDSIWR